VRCSFAVSVGDTRINSVIDHFGIACTDYPRSQQFYDRVLGALGYSRQADFGEAIGYGRDGKPVF
jgi:catechol 2,3-dioxygenase-like lactoylglutathione lyase family enzyme